MFLGGKKEQVILLYPIAILIYLTLGYVTFIYGDQNNPHWLSSKFTLLNDLKVKGNDRKLFVCVFYTIHPVSHTNGYCYTVPTFKYIRKITL